MPELTLESLAARVAALEKQLAEQKAPPQKKDWRRTIGMFAGNEFIKELDAEVAAMREAEREAARRGESTE
jgi:molybdopterin converting factor small subunit